MSVRFPTLRSAPRDVRWDRDGGVFVVKGSKLIVADWNCKFTCPSCGKVIRPLLTAVKNPVSYETLFWATDCPACNAKLRILND